MWDTLVTDCHVATMAEGTTPYGAIRDAAIAIADGRIAWVGPRNEIGTRVAREVRRLHAAWVTPGLIDCHTHLIFGGDRAGEWERRLAGVTYEQLARGGGGIVSTVNATRAATEDELAATAAARACAMAAQGVTTVEIKSGYGLDSNNELKMLRAAAKAGAAANVRVVRTFLCAHSIPPEYATDRAAYIDLICEQMIPAVAREKLAETVDVFCDNIAFTATETERIFAVSKAHGFAVKIHAEQLSDQGGAALAARYNALSADHLEHLNENGVAAMAAAGTVAVLLPCAFYFLRESKKPPVEALRRAGVPIAIATDCNPGTSPVLSPLIALNMASTFFHLTPEEALIGMTRNAAKALGMEGEIGTVEAGKSADLAVWNIGAPAELCYWLGAPLLHDRYIRGRSDRHERHHG
jgi:imidazolonepropionase